MLYSWKYSFNIHWFFIVKSTEKFILTTKHQEKAATTTQPLTTNTTSKKEQKNINNILLDWAFSLNKLWKRDVYSVASLMWLMSRLQDVYVILRYFDYLKSLSVRVVSKKIYNEKIFPFKFRETATANRWSNIDA